MGGHRAGDYAAQGLIDALAEVKPHHTAFKYLNTTLEAIKAVNAALFAEASKDPKRKGMGTTLVALLLYDAHMACIWAGDSRAYRWRDGKLDQLTTDHSLVQALVDRGDVGAHERQRHPQAHVITKAVGVFPDLELDKTFSMVLPGDKFLICSDGLSNCISDAEIADELAVPIDLSHQADVIMQRAMETDANDNISFVLLHT
jgi:serine/threonine protein phosphatase PrpC